MTTHQLMTAKVETETEPLGPTYWRTVATFDWRDPAKAVGTLDTSLTASQQLTELTSLKAAKYITVTAYVNVRGNLAKDVFAADWATRFLRIGTTDNTGLQGQPANVPPDQAGGELPPHFASPFWQGANPGGLHLQVRHLSGFFDEFKAATRYIKVQWQT